MISLGTEKDFQCFLTFLACCGVDSSILIGLDRIQALELYHVTKRDISAHVTQDSREMEQSVEDNFRALPRFSGFGARKIAVEAKALVMGNYWLLDMLLLDHRFIDFFGILKYTRDSPNSPMLKVFDILVYQPWNRSSPSRVIAQELPTLLCCDTTDLVVPQLTAKSIGLLSTWFNRIMSITSPEINLFFAGVLSRLGEGPFNHWELWRIVNKKGKIDGRFLDAAPLLAGLFMCAMADHKWTCVEEMTPKGQFADDLKTEWERILSRPNTSGPEQLMEWFRAIIISGKTLPKFPYDLFTHATESPATPPEETTTPYYRSRLTLDLYSSKPIHEGRAIMSGLDVPKLGIALGFEIDVVKYVECSSTAVDRSRRARSERNKGSSPKRVRTNITAADLDLY